MSTINIQKLQILAERNEELKHLLNSAEVINNRKKFTDYSKELAKLQPIVECFEEYKQLQEEIISTREMLQDEDISVRQMAKEEMLLLDKKMVTTTEQLQVALLPKDPNDERNIYLEIRAGTGGDEAAIFVGDLFRMYSKYIEKQGWNLEIITATESSQGGFKEIIVRVKGTNVYAQLKFESGAHRIQRVPVTESQGRIHTSACTVAILPEAQEVDHIDIKTEDLRFDTYRSSGAGGQHVNTTDSAVRITYLPDNIVVECQDERSQHKNKLKAMNLLQAKLLRLAQEKINSEQAQARKSLIGSGDRSERIRTYNFPQGRITDHRINLTLYKLEDFLEGNLDEVILPLQREYQAEQLSSMNEDE